MGPHIKSIDTALIDEEALEKALDDDQSFAEDEDDGVHPRAPSVKDCKEQELREKGEGEEDEVYDE